MDDCDDDIADAGDGGEGEGEDEYEWCIEPGFGSIVLFGDGEEEEVFSFNEAVTGGVFKWN